MPSLHSALTNINGHLSCDAHSPSSQIMICGHVSKAQLLTESIAGSSYDVVEDVEVLVSISLPHHTMTR